MQNCKSIVAMVFECYFFNQLLHCDVWPTEMSVLQEVKEVYFPGGRPVSMQNSGLLYIYVGMVCITGMLCTRSEENLFTCKLSSSLAMVCVFKRR